MYPLRSKSVCWRLDVSRRDDGLRLTRGMAIPRSAVAARPSGAGQASDDGSGGMGRNGAHGSASRPDLAGLTSRRCFPQLLGSSLFSPLFPIACDARWPDDRRHRCAIADRRNACHDGSTIHRLGNLGNDRRPQIEHARRLVQSAPPARSCEVSHRVAVHGRRPQAPSTSRPKVRECAQLSGSSG